MYVFESNFVGENQEVIRSQDRIVESLFFFDDTFDTHKEYFDEKKEYKSNGVNISTIHPNISEATDLNREKDNDKDCSEATNNQTRNTDPPSSTKFHVDYLPLSTYQLDENRR